VLPDSALAVKQAIICMNSPKVWICIPTFNGEAFLAAAIDSALAQTYNNYHILISDDGSEDRTAAIAQKFQQSNAKISFIQHPRLGLVENWNFCIDRSLQSVEPPKYIKFLCQDDLLAPNCLEELVAAAEQSEEIGMVFSRRDLVGELTPGLEWLKNLTDFWHELKPLQSGLDLLSDRHLLKPPDNKFGEPSNVLIRTQVFLEIGKFDPNFRQYCDLEMWWRICVHYQVAFVAQNLSSFRVHSQQASNINQQADLVWAEIYTLWCKILSNSSYRTLPVWLKRRVLLHFCGQAMAEYRSILWHQKWHRLDRLNYLMRSLLGSDLIKVLFG
jgi:glycosyltransferase involved in cell wall biosynthesis